MVSQPARLAHHPNLTQLMELLLRHTLTHGSSAAHAARHHLLQLIHVVGTAPLLMLDNVDALVHLGLLDHLAVGAHTASRVGLGELVADEGGRMEAGQGDELPAVAELGQTADVSLLVGGRHGRFPVEGRGEVVAEPGKDQVSMLPETTERKGNSLHLGPDGVDALGELLSLGIIGQLALHPDGIAVRGVRDGAVDRAVAAALETIVTLTGTRSIPVEEDVLAEEATSNSAGLAVRDLLALDSSLVLGSELLSVGVAALGNSLENGFIEALEVGLGKPLILNSLQGSASLTGALSSKHEVVQGLQVGVGAAEDEGVVAGIDGGSNKGSGLGVGTSNDDEVVAWSWLAS